MLIPLEITLTNTKRYGIAAATVEAIADVLLYPYGTTRIRILVSRLGTEPLGFLDTFNTFYIAEKTDFI